MLGGWFRNGNSVYSTLIRQMTASLEHYEENMTEHVAEARLENAYEYAQTPVVKP